VTTVTERRDPDRGNPGRGNPDRGNPDRGNPVRRNLDRGDPDPDHGSGRGSRPVPSDVARRRWKPQRWRRWGAGAVVLALLAGLVWIVAFSSVLAARSIRVEGTQRLSRDQILAAAGVRLGTPLVRVPRGTIARRVERLAEVRSARVELSFPDTVVIAVTERVAAAYRQTSAGHFTYVDATGRSFADLSAAPAALPQLAPSAAVANDTATLSAMAQISAALPGSVRAEVAQLTATSAEDITLALRDGRSVVWGDATHNADKARVLPALLARPGHVLDVSNPDQVFAH
jgi:cell division protein FtsQ